MFVSQDMAESYEHSLAYHAMVALDGWLYVVGGYTTVRYLRSVSCIVLVELSLLYVVDGDTIVEDLVSVSYLELNLR